MPSSHEDSPLSTETDRNLAEITEVCGALWKPRGDRPNPAVFFRLMRKMRIRILTQLELDFDKMPIDWVPQTRKMHSGIAGSRANEILLSLCFFPLLSIHWLHPFRIIFCKIHNRSWGSSRVDTFLCVTGNSELCLQLIQNNHWASPLRNTTSEVWRQTLLKSEQMAAKEMATHSNIPAWRIPWTEEPGRLESTGLQQLDTT